MSKSLKVMTIFGTRPEIIRLSAILKKLDDYSHHVMVHTGQNYDYSLNQVFFDDFQLRKPDHFLGVQSDTIGAQIGKILIGAERVIRAEQPDAVLILGDTNSALSSIIAKRYKVPVFHMEAGNRWSSTRTYPRSSTGALSTTSPTSTSAIPITPGAISSPKGLPREGSSSRVRQWRKCSQTTPTRSRPRASWRN